jgi:hypothetical protein
MPNKIDPLNRRLKKAEVKQFIDNGAKLHEEYSKDHYEKYWNGNEKQDWVYELPNGDFMLVFDPKGDMLPGKGNYYTRDSFLRHQRWRKKVTEDYKEGRASSVDYWRYYTKQGAQLFLNKDLNLDLISRELNIDKNNLDYSYDSLGKIDDALEIYPYGKAWETLYDALVFYVGEVTIKRIGGKWKVDDTPHTGNFPYVTVANTTLHYMPINIVWAQTDGLNPSNLRKATADEIRTNAFLHPKNNK